MTVNTFRSTIARLLRSLGYIAIVLGWLWLMVIALPPLIENDVFDPLLPSTDPAQETKRPPVDASLSPAAGVTVSIVTVIMLIVTFVTLWKLPKVVTKTGDKVITKSAETVLPILLHHKPIPRQRKRQLNRRIAYGIQLLFSTLPLAVLYMLPPIQEVSKDVIITVGAGLACAGVLVFTLAFAVDVQKTTSRTQSPASRG